MLGVFKLVSCKPPGSCSETPQGLGSSTFSKLVFSYVIVVNRDKFNFVDFLIIPKFDCVNLSE